MRIATAAAMVAGVLWSTACEKPPPPQDPAPPPPTPQAPDPSILEPAPAETVDDFPSWSETLLKKGRDSFIVECAHVLHGNAPKPSWQDQKACIHWEEAAKTTGDTSRGMCEASFHRAGIFDACHCISKLLKQSGVKHANAEDMDGKIGEIFDKRHLKMPLGFLSLEQGCAITNGVVDAR